MSAQCGIIYSDIFIEDKQGCLLPDDHEGPHEFVASDGITYQWETDFECECDHCMSGEGDYCTLFWPKPSHAKKGAGHAAE